MKVALLYPPYKPHTVFSENLKAVDDEFCFGPPIILAYVAAILERAGHKVMLLDANALGLSKEGAFYALKDFKPDLIGVRLETYHFHETLDWVRYLKPKIKVPVIAGGINVLLYPSESLSYKEIDFGIIGEAIDSLPELLRKLETREDVTRIKGLVYRDRDKVIVNPPENKRIDFNTYPFPARHLLPNERYYSFVSQRKNFTIMLTSVGCPFKCRFCVISKIPYRQRDPRSVIDEIEECYKKHGIREIDFFDGALFVDKDRIIKICREIRKRKIKIDWSCRSRVDLVDEGLLKEAAESGCRRIFYGIESASQEILENINKKVRLDQIEQAITLTRKYAIQPLGFFMVGNPGETKETVNESIRFAKRLKLSFVQVCRAIAKPGTDLDEMLIKKYNRDYWREYVSGNIRDQRLPVPWTSLTDKEMERYTKDFYRSFYFRPSIILDRLCKLKSFRELSRYIKVALKMFFQKREIL